MKKHGVLVLAAGLLIATTAHAQPGNYDASGRDGSSGSDGTSYSYGTTRSGSSGASGLDAGTVDVEIGFVPGTAEKQVYVRGVMHSASGGSRSVNDIFETRQMIKLFFKANGGDGGAGGNGSRGQDGDNGRNGSDGYYGSASNGNDGGNGDDGTNGGNGGNGGRGGDGGQIHIRLAKGSELLIPYVSAEANRGSGGRSGNGGSGGSGGRGGSGGSAGCTQTTYKSDGSVDQYQMCGSSGSTGRSGSDGSSGADGSSGDDGRSGAAQFLSGSGLQIRGSYDLAITGFAAKQSVEDGVFEPGEQLLIRTLKFKNVGEISVPAAIYSLGTTGSDEVHSSQGVLAPGASVEMTLPKPIAINASQIERGLPLALHLNELPVEMDSTPGSRVSAPVLVEQYSQPLMTTRQVHGALKVVVGDHSTIDYGTGSQIARGVRVVIRPLSKKPSIEIVNANGTASPFTQPIVFDIPLIHSMKRQYFSAPIQSVKGAQIGDSTSYSIDVEIQRGGRWVSEQHMEGATALVLDPSVGFTRTQDLSGVVCDFKNRWFAHRTVKRVYLEKVSGAETVKVHFDISMGFILTPPVYTVSVQELGPTLNAIVTKRALNSSEISNLLNSVIAPKTARGWDDTDNANRPKAWEMDSCTVK